MKFLLDVHVSTSIARALMGAGHDVIRAALQCPTAADPTLLAMAVEQDRILVTEDSDFTELIFARGHAAPPALLFIRCRPDEQPKMADRVLEALALPELFAHVIVLTPTATRHRPFPKADNDNG